MPDGLGAKERLGLGGMTLGRPCATHGIESAKGDAGP